MGKDFDEFNPKNGWAIFAMVLFAIAFFAFLFSIFIYESQRNKPKEWWSWIGFLISIILLVVSFAAFAFINVGGTKGYHYNMRYAPNWESRKVEIIDPSEIISVNSRPVPMYNFQVPQTPSIPINSTMNPYNYALY